MCLVCFLSYATRRRDTKQESWIAYLFVSAIRLTARVVDPLLHNPEKLKKSWMPFRSFSFQFSRKTGSVGARNEGLWWMRLLTKIWNQFFRMFWSQETKPAHDKISRQCRSVWIPSGDRRWPRYAPINNCSPQVDRQIVELRQRP